MLKVVNINMGEMAVSNDSDYIRTGSIGSCIVIVIYDREAKVGGMAHAILPTREKGEIKKANNNQTNNTDNDAAKYVDEAIEQLVKKIKALGGKRERLKAKLVGGARMFRFLDGDKYGIGYQNIQSAREKLKKLFIPIENEETGGTVGRVAEFNVANGLVKVITVI